MMQNEYIWVSVDLWHDEAFRKLSAKDQLEVWKDQLAGKPTRFDEYFRDEDPGLSE